MADLQQIADQQKYDFEKALKWWRAASGADKKLVWDAIQFENSDPVREVLSRFAQVGFTEVMLAAEDEVSHG